MDPLDAIGRVAIALGPLVDRVVFVGGAAAPLMISDIRAEGVRPTDDVDCVTQTTSRMDYESFAASLGERGFRNDMSEGAPICRWVVDGILVDVMPPDPSSLGFTNRWYAYAVESARWVTLPGGIRVRVASPIAFVATKLDAYHSPTRRYAQDVWASHDLEDLLAVIEGRPEFDAELAEVRPDARAYVSGCLRALLSDPNFVDAVEGHIDSGPSRTERAQALLARLRRLATLA